MFYLDQQFFSCIPDKDIRVFLPGPTILISPMLSHPGPDKNHMYLMHRLYRKSRIYFVKNDVTLCKLGVNVKNRTAVAGSVDFFKHK